MKQIRKHQKSGGFRLTRRALWLALAVVLMAGISAGAYAAQTAGLFRAYQEDSGYSISTKEGRSSGGSDTPIATNPDGSKWVPASDSEDNSTYYLYLEGETDPVVTLVMDGNEWTYYFSVVDSETAEYYVTEYINRDGEYTMTSDSDIQGEGEYAYVTTTSGGTVILYNTASGTTPPAFGSLKLTKKAVYPEGTEPDEPEKFTFTVTLSYAVVTDNGDVALGDPDTAALLTGTKDYGVYVDWTSSEETETDPETGAVTVTTTYAASAVISLGPGESFTLENIPAGVSYEVTEAEAEGYTTEWDNRTGAIVEDQTAAVVCTNTYTPTEPGPEPLTGSVRVKKLVEDAGGETAADDTEFKMNLSLTGLTAGETYSYTIFDQDNNPVGDSVSFNAPAGVANVSFTLTNGQYAEFTGLPVGCRYQAVENAAEGYTASYLLTGGGENHSYVKEKNKNYEENQELMTERETLDETEAAGGVSPVTVTFTNTKPDVPAGNNSVSVTVTKEWLNAEGASDNESHTGEQITLYLLQSSVYLEADEVDSAEILSSITLDGTEDNWTYTWTDLDRYTDGGQPYYYYVKEDAIDGFASTVRLVKDPYVTYRATDGMTTSGDYEYTVTNSTSVELPYTGGAGTAPLVVVGLFLVVSAAACLPAVRRRRERG